MRLDKECSVADPRTDGPWPDVELVTVYWASDAGDLALAKSMLQAAGIEYATCNESVQDVFGWGRFPTGLNMAMGMVQIQVRDPDAEYARELLGGLTAPAGTTDEA